jgi:hypothetical protein
MRDRYYISFNAGGAYSEFWPTNTPKITYRLQSGEIFKRPFVDKFKIGRLKNSVVFDIIAADFYDKTKFSIDYWYKVEVLGVAKFYFIGPVTSGKIDDQNDVYETTPEPKDTYRSILQKYEKKWQDRIAGQIFADQHDYYRPKLNTNFFANVDFSGWVVDITYQVSYGNNTGVERTALNQLVSATGDTDKVIVIIKNRNIAAGANPTMAIVNSAGTHKSNTITITANGKYTLTQNAAIGGAGTAFIELAQVDLIAGSSGSFDYEIYYPTAVSSGTLLETTLANVLNGATFMNLGLTIVSSYLWNDVLPTGHAVNIPTISTYFTANPTNDYVIEGTANWNYLWLSRNDALTTAKEDLTELSLKDIMDYLKLKLRAWWYIDEDDNFRIEHEYWFRNYAVQADLTSATYSGDKPEVDSRTYRYEKGDVYSQLNYKEPNQSHEDWIPYPVEFSATLTSDNKKDISSAYFDSDIEYLVDSPGDAESSGWLLLRCIAMGTKYLVDIDESTITAGNFYMNAHLGWAYLFANYWDYFAEAETGFVNNGAHTFVHVKEFLKQDHIRFHMTADLDWKKPFTLLNGKGWMEETEYIPETGMYDINVGFNPYE